MTGNPPLVVGIGASAGGIPALEGFFAGLGDVSGMAFVIVTHLSPDRKSQLREVISHYTPAQVVTAEDGMRVRPGVVHVVPEGQITTMRDGKLRLQADDLQNRERKPIDVFLSSLADDQHERAVGIILSGGDSDGTLGLKAIKQQGGFTLAQVADGSGPKHPQMPESAISSGLVDFGLPVEEMGRKLEQIVSGHAAFTRLILSDQGEDHASHKTLQEEIAVVLRGHSGHDFSGYKSKTFIRRVGRRMQVLQMSEPADYVERLRRDPDEVMALFRDLLINVTNFFRDADAFDALKEQVIPRIFEGRGASDTVRVWVPGCATGEEVYSIAMLMREHMDSLDRMPRVQLFATDIDEQALGVARAGRYPDSLTHNLTPERKKRFFVRDGASHVITKEVREMCIFSPHSVVSDPPFSRMDMVSCRNLLIYFGPDLQHQVIPTFHYALKPGGWLFLGTSESVSRHGDLFAPMDKKNRIFQSRGHGGNPRRPLVAYNSFAARHSYEQAELRHAETSRIRLRQRVEGQILERHAPAHVVVTKDGEIIFYSAHTGRFLEAPRGAPNRQILDMARRELRLDLRSALREAVETRRSIQRQILLLEEENGRETVVSLRVEALDDHAGTEPLFLVVFTPLETARRAGGSPPAATESAAAAERELRDTRERLQSTIEEYETALEELKATNEELVSVNEEAQSTNEELEASKEEMQSLNEELATINAELTVTVEELDRSNTDLKNLYAATRIASVFLDGSLVIRNFTPAASAFFNLRAADIGRPLTELAGALEYPALQEHVRSVFASGEMIEHRLFREGHGDHYLLRLVPYRDREDEIRGVVVTLVNITSLAKAEEQQRVLISELNHRVKNMLAVVISMANTTLRRSPSPEAFAETLIGRLRGMARAYALLSQANWAGIWIEGLIAAETQAHDPRRIRVEGVGAELSPEQALPLSMIIHELITNAMKYGALSTNAGFVTVKWTLEGEDIALTWRETGGPRVSAPAKSGFGLTLIEGQAVNQLQGKAEVHFEPEGFLLGLRFPAQPPRQSGE